MPPRLHLLTACLVAVVLLAGCSMLPQWRVFQKKVDPKLAEKSVERVEGERKAAAFIRDNSAAVSANPPAQLAAIHAVAVPLSSSLGEPSQPNAVGLADQAKIIAELRQGLVEEQKKAEQWKAFAKKYAGKEIEGTGINLAGPVGLLAFAGIIAACIACPAIGYVILRALPLLWGFFRKATTAIGEFGQAHPDSGKQLAEVLSRKMDTAHKRLVKARVPSVARLPVASTSLS